MMINHGNADIFKRKLTKSLQAGFDAEIAGLVAPRALVVEAARHPEVAGPPSPSEGRSGGAPGRLTTPPLEDVEAEWARAMKRIEDNLIQWVIRDDVVNSERTTSGRIAGFPTCFRTVAWWSMWPVLSPSSLA